MQNIFIITQNRLHGQYIATVLSGNEYLILFKNHGMFFQLTNQAYF